MSAKDPVEDRGHKGLRGHLVDSHPQYFPSDVLAVVFALAHI